MFLVIMNVDSAQRPHWKSMWYEGTNPLVLVPMFRQSARQEGVTYGSVREVPLDGDHLKLFLELQALHDAAFRMVCVHAFIAGYQPMMLGEISTELPVPRDAALASLHEEIIRTEAGKNLLMKLMTLGSACAVHEKAAD